MRGLRRVAETGIYLLSGRPGSGKSYVAVMQIVEEVCKNRRFVYTNLPLRLRALRAYLYIKGITEMGLKPQAARELGYYVRLVTRDHFNRFCNRLQAIDLLAGDMLKATGSNDVGDVATFTERECRQRARQQLCDGSPNKEGTSGPEVVVGEGANWIPPMAVLVMDELHKWYPNAMYGKEPIEILAYTSMHRHMLHKLYCMTQSVANVSVSFRRMAQECWAITNMRQVRFLWVTKWPFLAFRVVKFSASDVVDGKLRDDAQPVGRSFVIPWLDGGLFFRLYDSHSHVVSLKQAESEAGGLIDRVREKRRPEVIRPRTLTDRLVDVFLVKLWRLVFWPMRHWKLASLVALVLFIVYKAGSGRVVAGDAGGKAVAGVAAASQPASRPAYVMKLAGVTARGCVVNGRYVELGAVVEGALLVGCDPVEGETLWGLAPGHGFLWGLDGRVRWVGRPVARYAGWGGTGPAPAGGGKPAPASPAPATGQVRGVGG